MQKRKIISAVYVFLLLLITFGTPAHAVRLGLESGLTPFTGEVAVSSGDTLLLDLVMSEILPGGIGGYSFNIIYDDAELSLTNYAKAFDWDLSLPVEPKLPKPIKGQSLGGPDTSTPGLIFDINGTALGATPSDPNYTVGVDSFIIAQLTFSVLFPLDDGSPDLGIVFGAGQGVLGETDPVVPTIIPGADLAPVPEPASLILIGTGLVGLIGFARKRS